VTIGNFLYRVQWETLAPESPPVPPARAAAPRPAPRDHQESCEMPVPLPDAGGAAYPRARPQLPSRPPEMDPHPSPSPPLIVPDDHLPPPGGILDPHDSRPPSPAPERP
jgi:hypothetical protein